MTPMPPPPRRLVVPPGEPRTGAELHALVLQLGKRACVDAIRWMAGNVPWGVGVHDLDDDTARRMYAEAVQPHHDAALARQRVDCPF